MCRLRFILLLSLVALVACRGDETGDVPPAPSRVISIECPTTAYAIEEGGSVEVEFRVHEPRALFNHVVSSLGCQVQLRLSDHITHTPTEFSLASVVPSDEEDGLYRATITDRVDGAMYSRRVAIVIKLESGELVRSNPITLTTADYVGGITGVTITRASNPTLSRDISFVRSSLGFAFDGYVEEYVRDRTFILSVESDGIDRMTCNGENFINNTTAVDLRDDVTITAYSGDYAMEYTLHLECFTGLPVVHIETPGRQGIYSKEVWVEGSRLWIDGMAQFDDIEDAEMAIRGRGNSTWGYEKKAYNIKFTEKQRVLGMPKHKRWVLLANYMDRTLLRNRVAYYLAEQTSLAWTPHCEFVELMLNGKHMGQYLLTEQVRVDNDRVDITEMTPADNSGDAITGGYLLELDFHFDHEWQWYSSHGIPFSVKFPDEDELTTAQFEWIQRYIHEVEEAIYGSDYRDAATGYRKYIDPQSFIDYWLIYEICVNHELANPGSVFLSKDRNGKLCAGPVWDFDWGTFSYNASPAAQWDLFMTHAWWYGRLFDDPDFWALAKERWRVLKPRFESVFDFIDAERRSIEQSWYRNFEVWDIWTTTNGDEYLSYDEAVDRLIRITRERLDIIDRALR